MIKRNLETFCMLLVFSKGGTPPLIWYTLHLIRPKNCLIKNDVTVVIYSLFGSKQFWESAARQ